MDRHRDCHRGRLNRCNQRLKEISEIPQQNLSLVVVSSEYSDHDIDKQAERREDYAEFDKETVPKIWNETHSNSLE